MSQIDLILFDCDGVLVDSEILAANLGARLLTEVGVPIAPRELCERYAGMEWRAIMDDLETRHQMTLPETLFAESNALLDAMLANELEAIDGVRELLSALQGQRCICSNSSSARLQIELERTALHAFFGSHVYSAMDLGPGRTKPQPDVYLHGAAQFAADPARCLVVEDSVHGVTAARRAGMTVIGFTGAGHSYPEHAARLTDAGATIVVDSMPSLQPVLGDYGLL
jgi:HAD superfamily hydrolase (TIGR01509 family)